MPLYISAGLPGPFRYVARVDGGALYWLLIGWWLVLLKWFVIAVVMFYVYVIRGLYLGGRWAWQRWGRR
jgi:hypothetical protein